jgi:hypothetical protein
MAADHEQRESWLTRVSQELGSADAALIERRSPAGLPTRLLYTAGDLEGIPDLDSLPAV